MRESFDVELSGSSERIWFFLREGERRSVEEVGDEISRRLK